MEFKQFTPKQIEIIKQGYAALNIYTGGVRAGKTFLSYFEIPELIAMFPKSKGVLIGKTLASLSENILDPMRNIYGKKAVSEMKSSADGSKYAIIFNKRVRCVGANDKKAVTKIQGATYAWAVGDEVATWDKATFAMLMSRLSEKGAICIATANPEDYNHWFNRDYILKDGIDKKVYNFTIDDNPFLDKAYVENLKNIYKGTVLFERLILGLWASGQGAIYKRFIEQPELFIIDSIDKREIVAYAIGIDFGENISSTTFKLVGLKHGYSGIVILEEEHIEEHKDADLLISQWLAFLRKCLANGWRIDNAYYDNAQKTLGETLKSAVLKAGLPCIVDKCTKEPINERVNAMLALMGGYRVQILKKCEWAIRAFKEAKYKDNSSERLDEVGPENPVDHLDSAEYAIQKWTKNLIQQLLYN